MTASLKDFPTAIIASVLGGAFGVLHQKSFGKFKFQHVRRHARLFESHQYAAHQVFIVESAPGDLQTPLYSSSSPQWLADAILGVGVMPAAAPTISLRRLILVLRS
jgi:hypothetical protein